MNRRRELILQRISRIGGFATSEDAVQNTVAKGRPTGTLTIEAALGAYMMKDDNMHGLRRRQDSRDSYIRTPHDPDRQRQDQLARQMAEYMSDFEGSQLANAKSDLENKHSARQLNIEKVKKALAQNPSARYQLSHYKKSDEDGQTAFDRLDANRCSGFLLYSYNKKGVHSVLGEHIFPGGRGVYTATESKNRND